MNDKSRELCQGLGELAATAGRMLGLVSEIMIEPPLVVQGPPGKTVDQVLDDLPPRPYNLAFDMLNKQRLEILKLERENAKLKELLNETLDSWARIDKHPASVCNRDSIRKRAGLR